MLDFDRSVFIYSRCSGLTSIFGSPFRSQVALLDIILTRVVRCELALSRRLDNFVVLGLRSPSLVIVFVFSNVGLVLALSPLLLGIATFD